MVIGIVITMFAEYKVKIRDTCKYYKMLTTNSDRMEFVDQLFDQSTHQHKLSQISRDRYIDRSLIVRTHVRNLKDI